MLWRPPRLLGREVFGILVKAELPVGLRRALHSQTCRIHPSHPTIAGILATPPTDPPTLLTAIGFVRTVRNQKSLSFVELGDGSTVHSLQALLKPSLAKG